MREIKFRAWHERHGWLYFVIKPTDENVNHTISFVSAVGIQMMREGLSRWGQFTGIKDKSGREIYEGDIVHSDNEGAYAVGFNAEYGCWEIECHEERYDDDGEAIPYKTGELLANAIREYGMRSIGNVYENREELTET